MKDLFLRLGLSFFAGIIASLGLFSFMSILIAPASSDLAETELMSPVEFVRLKQQSEVKLRKRQLPVKPPESIEPPLPKLALKSTKLSLNTDFERPNIPLGLVQGVGAVIENHGAVSRQAAEVPLVRIHPAYPRKARMQGIEGNVIVRFTITEDGGVENVEIVDANPPRIFNREVRRAVSRWKYKPKIVDGRAVSRVTEVEFPFSLEEGS